MSKINTALPISQFETGLSRKGYTLNSTSLSCRKIGKAGNSTYCIVPIEGHGQSALYLLAEGANGTFDLWELEPTPFSISHTVESVEKRLPPLMSVRNYLTALAEKMA